MHVVLLLCLVASPLLAGQLAGVITSGGHPIPGVALTATLGDNKVSTVTDESGHYTFNDLGLGVWAIQAGIFGFKTEQREVLMQGPTETLDWTLELKPRVEVRANPPAAPKPAPAEAATAAARPARNAPEQPGARAREAQGGQRPAGPPGPGGRPGTGNGRGQGGFQSVAVNQSIENQVLAGLNQSGAPTTESAGDTNESFLVSGSLSRGLSAPQEEDLFAGRRAEFAQRAAAGEFGRPGFGPEGGGQPGAGPGGPGGGPGSGPGFGGGGGGGFGGRGGGGFGGGPGGPGGRGGFSRGGPPGGRERWSDFGNRRRSNRESIRGAAFFTLRNSALDARPYSLTGQTVGKPSYAQARFGLVGGGMLRIPKVITSEKTFFFVNFFATRSREPYQGIATLPTPDQRGGDFSQSGSSVFDPLTGQPFANNRAPASRWSPAAAGLLSFIPQANQPGLVQNYQFLTSVPQNTNNLGVRLNHTLTRKDSLSLNLNLQNRNSQGAQLYGYRDNSDGRGFSSSLGWVHNFGPRFINRVSWNFSRNRTELLPFFAFKDNVAARLGIAGTSQDPINFGPPNLSFTNFGGLTDGSAMLRRDQTSSAGESVTVVRGQHNITTGFDYRRMQLNSRTDQNARGTFTFSGIATSGFDAQGQPLAGTGFDLADLLLGLPQASSIRFGASNTYFRASAYGSYFMDDWRLRPSFTLNLGLRYEYFTPFRELYGRIANLDIAPGFTNVAVVTPDQAGPYSGAFPAALVDPDKNNFSPRIGIAWRPTPKRHVTVRAGYGIFYNGSIYNQFPSRLASQPPFANTATLTTSLARVLTLDNGFAPSPDTRITNTYAVNRDYLVGYAQTWNFSVQQDLRASLVLELGYLGTKGTKLDIQRLPNRAAPGSPLTAEQRRQIGNAVGFTFDSSEGNSIYHAAQVRLTRRFRRGLSANALYTFSKSIDNASTFGGGAAVVAQNDKDLAAERGLSSFDQRHTLSLFYIISSPFGPNAYFMRGGGKLATLLREWNISGGLTATSGMPLTARVLGNLSNSGGTGSVGSGRADATGAPVDGGRFFNLAAFTIPPAGRFGDAARNTIPGPSAVSMNLSLGRSFRMGDDRRRLELRVDSQNFLNHVSFTNIATVVNATNYGLPVATRGMRTMTATMRFRF